jgi:AAA+ superfamily predicted ATPase
MSAACERELGLLLRSGYRMIGIESFEEDRTLKLLERVAGKNERGLHVWSLAGGWSGSGDGAGSLDLGLVVAADLEGSALLVILDAHTVLSDATAVRRLRDSLPRLAQQRQTVVFVSPALNLPIELERDAAHVSVPLPTELDLGRLFARVVESAGDAKVDEQALEECVRAALGLTGSEAVRVFRKAWMEAGAVNAMAVAHVVSEKRKALRRTPALSFHDADFDLDAVGGLGELKHWLRERKRTFGEEARNFGLPAPRGLLLLGVQGCGKSLCAKAVAREWHFPLVRLDLGAAFGDPNKSPEVTMREATAIAESLAPVVLWIDEIEKGFSATSADPNASRVFGSFLTWMAEKKAPVFVVATANDVTALPPELLRRGRFDDLFFVDLPSEAERAEIFAIHLRQRGRDPAQFPLAELAEQSTRLSGAEIEQVVAAGLYTAFAEDRDLTDNDLANAIQETVPLYETYEERIKELRNWARTRARAATTDVKMVDLFTER